MLMCWICCPILFWVQYQFNISNFIHQFVFITQKALRCDNNWGVFWTCTGYCAQATGLVGRSDSEIPKAVHCSNNGTINIYTVYIQTIDGTASCWHILQLFLPTNDIKACWAKKRSVLEASVDQHIWCVQPRSPKCGRAKKVTKGQLDNACTGFFHTNCGLWSLFPLFKSTSDLRV